MDVRIISALIGTCILWSRHSEFKKFGVQDRIIQELVAQQVVITSYIIFH